MKTLTHRIATTTAMLLMLGTGLPTFAKPSEEPAAKSGFPDNGAAKGQMIFKVVDGSGSGISGAHVFMTHNGHTIHFMSKADGNARDLEPGVYTIAARKAGVGRNRVSTAVTTEAPTTFTMTLTPHVGYSGGFHRVWRRRRGVAAEVVAPARHERVAAGEHAKRPAVTEKGEEPLDTTPNGALKRLPGTRRARGAGAGGGVGVGGGAGGGGGGVGVGPGGGGTAPKLSRPVGKATAK